MLNMHWMNATNHLKRLGKKKFKRKKILKHFFETLERYRALGVRTEAGESEREECKEHVFPQRLSTIWSRFRFRKGEQGEAQGFSGGVGGCREVRTGGSAAQAGKGEAEHETGNSERLQWQRFYFRFN